MSITPLARPAAPERYRKAGSGRLPTPATVAMSPTINYKLTVNDRRDKIILWRKVMVKTCSEIVGSQFARSE